MPIIAPPKQRHSLQDEGSSLKIVIPSRKNFFVMAFLGFWLIGWAFGEIAVGGTVLAGIAQLFFRIFDILDFLPEIGKSGLVVTSGVGLFMLLWLAGWTAGGCIAIYSFLWQLAGKEIVEINYDVVKMQRAVFGFGRTKEYLATHITDFRVTPWTADHNIFGWSRASYIWGMSDGLLAFDYGAKTYRFGSGIDEAEAKQILEKVVARFPQYRVRHSETG